MSEDKNNDAQEKSAEPTPERLRKAREKGDIAKSTDVTAAAAYLGLLAAAAIGAAGAAKGAGEALFGFLATPQLFADRILTPGGEDSAARIIGHALLALSPLFIVPFLFVLVALYAQQAVVVAPSKLVMQLSRISLISNAKQKFGLTGLVEFAKSTVKLITISIVFGLILVAELEHYTVLPMAPGKALPELLLAEGMRLLIATTVIAMVIAGFDYFWRLFDHRRKLRMSHQELRDETKEAEGDPHMKQSRRARAREIATNRMLLDVPEAEVVIVNPTHYAVALQWTRKPGSAPVCVAKGVDEIALRIREIAGEHSIPIHSDPPTARMLHESVEIGMEIVPEHYQAVAVAIRFADEMRAKARTRGHRPNDGDRG